MNDVTLLRMDRKLDNIDKYMSALMAFMVDMPSGSEVPDAARETAFCWATLSRVREHGDLNEFSYNIIGDVITRLRRASRLLEKVYERQS